MCYQSHTNYCVIGGDLRQYYLVEKLKSAGYQVFPFRVQNLESHPSLVEAIVRSDCIVLPTPYSKDKKNIPSGTEPIPLGNILGQLNEHTIFGGCFSEELIHQCKHTGSSICDFMKLPEFQLLNAISTAEGAIAEAICHSHKVIHMHECLVLGYGACGIALANTLLGLHGNVTVCARSQKQRTLAHMAGCRSISFTELPEILPKTDFIFNTVPSMVLDCSLLRKISPNTTIIDIASSPGGIDFEACKSLNLSAFHCLGLPGTYAPETSAEIMYQAICSQMAEMR